MKRKTFTTRQEAEQYQQEIAKAGDVSVIGELGEKFRVYSNTQKEIQDRIKFIDSNYTEKNAKFWLRNEAYRATEAVSEALEMQTAMQDNSVYDYYETSVRMARLLTTYGTFSTAKEVLDFIESTNKYDKEMLEFIDNTLDEYDYNGEYEKEEVANGQT